LTDKIDQIFEKLTN